MRSPKKHGEPVVSPTRLLRAYLRALRVSALKTPLSVTLSLSAEVSHTNIKFLKTPVIISIEIT